MSWDEVVFIIGVVVWWCEWLGLLFIIVLLFSKLYINYSVG